MAGGGIHTGFEEPLSGLYTWPSALGSAVLTIRKNKVYGNGTGTDAAGGGIDVMWASGTIENNVVYENKFAGIRVGDGHVTNISHNTVVSNGLGGIVYHDGTSDGTTPCYDCRPHGDAPVPLTLKDNIIVYNGTAALRGMSTANAGYTTNGGYSLLYANNTGWAVTTPDCTYPANFRCYIAQYGFSASSPAPNDIFGDPLFTGMANDVYTLTESSPGSGAASDSGDRGAWGGTYPMDW